VDDKVIAHPHVRLGVADSDPNRLTNLRFLPDASDSLRPAAECSPGRWTDGQTPAAAGVQERPVARAISSVTVTLPPLPLSCMLYVPS
jgi:hypothetical protein